MDLEVARTPDVEDGGRCLCGRDSTEGGAEDETLGLQVQFNQHFRQVSFVKLIVSIVMFTNITIRILGRVQNLSLIHI